MIKKTSSKKTRDSKKTVLDYINTVLKRISFLLLVKAIGMKDT